MIVKKKKVFTVLPPEPVKTKVVNDTILISDPCLKSKRSAVGFIPDPEKLQIMDVSEDRFNDNNSSSVPPISISNTQSQSAKTNRSNSLVKTNNQTKPSNQPTCMEYPEDVDRHKIEENEQFIIELLSKTQPHHDHCYTTIFGQRTNSEQVEAMLTRIDDHEEAVEEKDWTEELKLPCDKRVTFFISDEEKQGKKKRPAPILFLRHR